MRSCVRCCRLPDGRQHQRRRGHRPRGLPAVPPRSTTRHRHRSPKAWLSTVTTGYDEIAAVVGKSPDNCRQIAVRARRQVEADDTQGLVRLLAADVVVYADGGGKTPTILRPLYGRERVARMFGQIRPWSQRLGARSIHYAEVNGQPGALYLNPDGHPVLVVSLDIADDLVQTVRAITNPDKLRHLTPPTDPD